MRVWRPVRSLGGVAAVLLALALWSLAAWLIWALLLPVLGRSFWGTVGERLAVWTYVGQPSSAPSLSLISGQTFWLALGAFLLLALGIVLLYWGAALLALRYTFDRNGLTLHWGGIHQAIPMNRITAVRRWAEGERVRERGLRWPGHHRGHGRSAELGPVEFYATAGRPAQVLVCTAEGSYVLSPRNPEEFVQEMEVRRNLGITRQLAQERRYWGFLGWTIWRDPVLRILVGAALLVNLSLLALLCYRFPSLPPRIPIHFGESASEGIGPDYIGPSQELFRLPAFGLLILVANLVLGILLHRNHRLLVLLLSATALVVQVMFWLGAFYILYH
jgi:hypothetical protein